MPEPMTPERLAEIKARAEATTVGPWFLRDEGTYGELLVQYRTEPHGFRFPVARAVRSTPGYAENADFIAHARQDVPDLVAEVGRLREENGLLERRLLSVAKLAADRPMFDNPIAVCAAQIVRDSVLRKAGLVNAEVPNAG